MNGAGRRGRGRPRVPTPDPNGPRPAGRRRPPPRPRLRSRNPAGCAAHHVLGAAAWLSRPQPLPAGGIPALETADRAQGEVPRRSCSCRGPAPGPSGTAGCFVGCRGRPRQRWPVAGGGRARAGPLRWGRGSRQGWASAVAVGSGVPVTVAVVLVSIVVSIPACHAGDRGSIPRRGGSSPFRAAASDLGPSLRALLLLPPPSS